VCRQNRHFDGCADPVMDSQHSSMTVHLVRCDGSRHGELATERRRHHSGGSSRSGTIRVKNEGKVGFEIGKKL
jgi:hypothetical protein